VTDNYRRSELVVKNVSRHLLSKLTGEIVAWLNPRHAACTRQQLLAWDAAHWQAARQVVVMQGIASYLHTALPGTAIYAAAPASFLAWLAHQYEHNAARLRWFHQELSEILQLANGADIRVMPLKGSLLTTVYYPTPALRPMADIDLLIEPAALGGMMAIMKRLGYRYLKLPNEYQNEYKFVHPTANRIVDAGSEHPENPRPVEVHTGLRSGVWGGAGVYDGTAPVWASAQEVNLLGAHAWVPTPAQLLTALVTHAFRHFFRNEGRIMHWLDLAYVAAHVRTLHTDQANWTHPVYRMAQRALPDHFAALDFAPLAGATHGRIRQWSDTVALNADCGLMMATVAPEYRNRALLGRLGTAWDQWRPNPWRLAVAFGDTPVALAYGRYGFSLLTSLWVRFYGKWASQALVRQR
jgi:hypothetical protein